MSIYSILLGVYLTMPDVHLSVCCWSRTYKRMWYARCSGTKSLWPTHKTSLNNRIFWLYRMGSYLDLSFDKGGNVILIFKDGESLQQVMFQPLPVLCDLFTGGSCTRGRRGSQSTEGVMFQRGYYTVVMITHSFLKQILCNDSDFSYERY